MNREDIVKGFVCQSKNGVRKIRILCVEGDRVAYEQIIFGNSDIKYIQMDKLLENFKKADER